MNQRAFNLFTALVSFVLIMLTILLINSMTETESGTVATINDISAQSQMQTAADLARADAIQVFNYGLRYRIEEWLSRPTNWYLLQPGKTWSEIKQDYACVNFGGCRSAGSENSGVQFADITSKTMVGILEVGQTFGRYEITLEKDERQLFEALVATTTKSIESGDFFEVVDCDMPETNFTAEQIRNCLGTFYVKLKLSSLAPEEYEKLPKIVVKNSATGDYLKQGILPHADLRIYVPLRIFKAIAQSKYYADNRVFNKNDFFKSMMLGMCDPGSCAPRTDPTGTTGKRDIPDSACPGSKGTVPGIDNGKGPIKKWPAKNSDGSIVDYDADDPSSIKDALQLLVGKQLCSDAATLDLIDVDPADGLNLIQDNSGCNIYSSSVLVETFASKTTKFSEYYTDPQYEDKAYCAKTTEIRARIRFEETEPKYKVNKNNKNIYTIELLDSYTSTTDLDPNSQTNWCYTKCTDTSKKMGEGCASFKCTPTP